VISCTLHCPHLDSVCIYNAGVHFPGVDVYMALCSHVNVIMIPLEYKKGDICLTEV
jgi:hypothetical protein